MQEIEAYKRRPKDIKLEDYRHLNEQTPLSAWVGEFLHRNAAFRKEWKQLLATRPRTPEAITVFERKYGIWSFVGDSIGKCDQKPVVQLFPPVRALWGFSKTNRKQYGRCISEYSRRRKKADPTALTFRAAMEHLDPELSLNCLVGQRLGEGKFAADRRLLISIDTRYPRWEIEPSVTEILRRIVSTYDIAEEKGIRRRYREWKYYLIIHDLKQINPKASSTLIARLFEPHRKAIICEFQGVLGSKRRKSIASRKCPERDEEQLTPKGVDRHLKNANELISRGYLKFIPRYSDFIAFKKQFVV